MTDSPNSVPIPAQGHNPSTDADEPGIKFAIEDPQQTDAFGGHDRVAMALVDAITSEHPPRSIGILGPWGSGKSLIVRHVREELTPSKTPVPALVPEKGGRKKRGDGKRTYVYVYDAWMHQSDAPRRSFVEHFLRHVAGNATLSPRWQDQLNRLTGRLDVTDTTETPVMTTMAAWILLSCCMIPLATTAILRSESIASLFGAAQPSSAAGTVVGVGLFFNAVPLALVGIEIVKRWVGQKRRIPVERETTQDSWLVSLFVNKRSDRTVKRVIKDPVPSSFEFQQIVSDLAEALGKGHSLSQPEPTSNMATAYGRLLVVIDNLDRLPDEEAKALWSTMRSLFAPAEPRDGQLGPTKTLTLPQMIVIVPLDETGVSRIYGDETESHARSDGFLEKTFDITVRVPRTRLADWETHFEKTIMGCLPGVVETSLPTLTHLVRTHIDSLDEPATPRHLNALVNRIVTMWLQWQAELDIVPVAYYALNQRAIDKDLLGHLSSSPVIGRHFHGWESALCAMHFGVPKTQAIEVALSMPLDAFIRAATVSESLVTETCAHATIPGFSATFAKVLARRQRDGAKEIGPGYGMLLNAARLLHALADAIDTTIAWRELRAALDNSHMERPMVEDDQKGLMAMLSALPSPKVPILQKFLDTARSSGSDTMNGVKRYEELLCVTEPHLANEPTHVLLKVPFAGAEFAQLCSGLIEHPVLLNLLNGPEDTSATELMRVITTSELGTFTVLMKLTGILLTAAPIDADVLVAHAKAGVQGREYSSLRHNAFLLLAALLRRGGDAATKAAAYLGGVNLTANIGTAIQNNDRNLFIAVIACLLALPPMQIPDLTELPGVGPLANSQSVQLADCVRALMPRENRAAYVVAACQQQPWLTPVVADIFTVFATQRETTSGELVNVLKQIAKHMDLFTAEQRQRIVTTTEGRVEFGEVKGALSPDVWTILASDLTGSHLERDPGR